MTDKWVKQLAWLAALLCAGLSLSHGVALATCGIRFALVYCVAMFMGRLVCQMWLWAASAPSPRAANFANNADTFSTAPSSDEAMMGVGTPIEQGG
jgi:hypothetical protein